MGDTVAAQLVGHEPHGFLSLTLQQSAKESPRCTPVPTFALSRGLMRDFGAIVRVSPRVMGDQRHEVPMGDTVAAQLVGHEPHGFLSLTLQQSAKESPR